MKWYGTIDKVYPHLFTEAQHGEFLREEVEERLLQEKHGVNYKSRYERQQEREYARARAPWVALRDAQLKSRVFTDPGRRTMWIREYETSEHQMRQWRNAKYELWHNTTDQHISDCATRAADSRVPPK